MEGGEQGGASDAVAQVDRHGPQSVIGKREFGVGPSAGHVVGGSRRIRVVDTAPQSGDRQPGPFLGDDPQRERDGS